MPAFAFDPVLGHASAAALAILLIVGAWYKFADLDAFRFAVERYRLLPGPLARALAIALPPAEALAAALLLVPGTRAAGALLAAVLLGAFTAAIAANLLRGLADIDCGCGPAGHRQRLSWALVARNVALLVVCAIAGSPEQSRELVWLDAFTGIFATLALCAVYAATNELFSDAKRFSSEASALPADPSRFPSPRTGS